MSFQTSEQLLVVLEPSITQVMDAFFKRSAEDVFTALPGVVKAFNAVTMTADIQLAVKLPRRNGDGSAEYEEAPILGDVPIVYPRGGGFQMTFPLAAGDGVLVVFSTLDTGAWETSGLAPSEPLNLIRGGLNSCVALPGWNAITAPMSPLDATSRESKGMIGKDGGLHVELSDAHVDVVDVTDATAAQGVVMVTALKAVLDLLFTTSADFPTAKTNWAAASVSPGTLWAGVGSTKLRTQL